LKKNPLKISKREFIRQCSLCAGGFVLGAYSPNSFSVSLNSDPGKFSREALFYSNTDNGLLCEKCPQSCCLNDGDVGFCRSRVATDGKICTIAYGNPCAVHIDPIEKKPFFHFLPTTQAFSIAAAGCNLRCLNCQNWQISQMSPRESDNIELMPQEVVKACINSGSKSIAYTYSEPTTFFEYTYDTAKLAREQKIHNLLKSNGFINEKPLRYLCKVLDAANIDLKIFNEAIYKKLSSGKLEPVLKALKIFREEGVWLEITNLIIPAWTDNYDTIKRMCEWLCANDLSDAPLHFSKFTPLYKLSQLPSTPIDTLTKACAIAKESGIKFTYLGNVAGYRAENTYCPKCKKIIIERHVFTILNNHIVKGKCKFCGEKISGVWG
jgi:pyruvate formate lyase activating enzyme